MLQAVRGVDVIFHLAAPSATPHSYLSVESYVDTNIRAATSGRRRRGISLFLRQEVGGVVGVCESERHPLWTRTLPADQSMAGFLRPEVINRNRQDMPAYYRISGAFCGARPAYVREQNGFLGPRTYAHIMPQERSVDIDDELSFMLCEAIVKRGGTG